jgi:hypothetical protein
LVCLTNLLTRYPPMPPQLNRRRAQEVLNKIDAILAWEARHENERDTKFVELGKYLCEVRAGQYWRLEKLKSFDEFLERRFPESRRKAYYLMSIHEQLPPQVRRELKQVGWTKGLELAKLARQQGQRFESATWLKGSQDSNIRMLNKDAIEERHSICFCMSSEDLSSHRQTVHAARALRSPLSRIGRLGLKRQHAGPTSRPSLRQQSFSCPQRAENRSFRSRSKYALALVSRLPSTEVLVCRASQDSRRHCRLRNRRCFCLTNWVAFPMLVCVE